MISASRFAKCDSSNTSYSNSTSPAQARYEYDTLKRGLRDWGAGAGYSSRVDKYRLYTVHIYDIYMLYCTVLGMAWGS